MPEIPGGATSDILAANPLVGTDETTAGVTGQSNVGPGVLGQSLGIAGGIGTDGTVSISLPPKDGVLGQGTNGVRGVSSADYGPGPAPTGAGVWGTNNAKGPGVYGTSASGDGVLGNAYHGVHGQSSATGGAGVWGESTGSGAGVSGTSTSGAAIVGTSAGKYGVQGITTTGIAVYGKSNGSGSAGQFDGNVTITGDITSVNNITIKGDITSVNNITVQKDMVLSGADCAEDFDLLHAGEIEPGSVVVFNEGGTLSESDQPYNKKVAGVVSGAGTYRPGLILDRHASDHSRVPLALVGKVYCKVDATYGSIEVGDLLTTSATAGCAMKATNSMQAFGAVIGKALASHSEGPGLIPILVALQ